MSDDFTVRFTDRQNKIEPKALPLRRSGNRSQKVPLAQPVFAKMKGTNPPSWGGYGKGYLMGQKKDHEPERGYGFDAEREGVHLGDEMQAWQHAKDKQYYHVVLSAERSKDLDLPSYTREVIQAWETDLQRRITWVAIAHYDTKTPHVHLIVREKNEEGQRQPLHNHYVNRGRGHDIAEQIATNRLGYRLANQTIERRALTIGREAYVETDHALVWKADTNHVVDLAKETPTNGAQRELLEQERKRVMYLADLGLAKQIGEQSWQLYHKLPQEMRFRGSNREHAPEWRKPKPQEQNRERQGQIIRAIESERSEGRER